MITLLGLGPGPLGGLTLAALAALEAAPLVLLRTERHPAAAGLRDRGVAFTPLDSIYEAADSFPEVYDRLAATVLERAAGGDVVYAVPGHPLVGEESVRLVLERARAAGLPTRVLPAASFVDAAATALANAGVVDDFSQLQVLDALSILDDPLARVPRFWILETAPARPPIQNPKSGYPRQWVIQNPDLPALLYQIDDPGIASQVKLALMEAYPDDHPVAVVWHAGVPGEERVVQVPLYELDRPAAGEFDHLTCVYVPPLAAEQRRPDFADFVEIIARLRAPDGCPWDREQNYQTLKRFVLEEAYEVLEAVDSGDPAKLCDELGDLMIQVLMYAQFAREDGDFDIRDVIANVVDKLVRRHPHVFGDVTAETSEEVLKNWEQIKRGERPERESVLDGVPVELPALMKAAEVSKRAVRVGFEWPALDDVFAKLDEEVAELREAVGSGDRTHQRDEIGDLLFTVVNVARWLKVDPEEALRVMVARFTTRFREVERLAAASGRPLTEMDLTQLDELWEQAKQREG